MLLLHVKSNNSPPSSVKYWHPGCTHGKKLATVVSHNLYLECASGDLVPEWKVNKPIDFFRFREKLSMQTLEFNPLNNKYPGDNKLREYTRATKQRREKRKYSPTRSPSVSSRSPSVSSIGSVDTEATGVTPELIQRMNEARTCGFLGNLRQHIASVRPLPNGGHRKCVVCHGRVYEHCSLCNAALHYSKKKIPGCPDEYCFFVYHDTGCIGVPKGDWKVNHKRMDDWSLVSSPEMLQAHYNSVHRVAAASSPTTATTTATTTTTTNDSLNSNSNRSDNNDVNLVNDRTPTGNGGSNQRRRIGDADDDDMSDGASTGLFRDG